MSSRAFKLRFRRRLRMRKVQVEAFGQQAEEQLEHNFFRRLDHLGNVRRFVAVWLVLIGLLAGCIIAQIQVLGVHYKSPQPAPGGTYSEGIIGAFTNANPLYATSPVDASISKLLFAGLFTYDQENNLKGDLAAGISLDARGTTYTVKLKPGLRWHDGRPLTAADVAFTYQVIQNPDAQSPLRTSWQGIVVKATDDRTVTFTLPGQLTAFPYSLTNGIVPKHLLEGKSMASLRTLPFNTSKPVGAGPFKFEALEVTGGAADRREEQIALVPFTAYNGGTPQLDRFVIHSYRDEGQLRESFEERRVDAMVGLSQTPDEYMDDGVTRIHSFPMTAAVMSFFRTTSPLLKDKAVRQALVQATDRPEIIQSLQYPAIPVKAPILKSQVGYDSKYEQPPYNLEAAKASLEAAGWRTDGSGIRQKDGQRLELSLYAQNSSEYTSVADRLQKQWRQAGVDLQIILQESTDFQATLSSAAHTYDVLLYGIAIGKDPDVYVYWDSRNADIRSPNRLNFSEYTSPTADAALQAGRTRADATLRAIKYQPFLQAWRDDAPAVGLYQPRHLYITRTKVYGLEEHLINTETERFANVQNWMIREKDVPQTKQ